jgi:hypothetical protein
VVSAFSSGRRRNFSGPDDLVISLENGDFEAAQAGPVIWLKANPRAFR